MSYRIVIPARYASTRLPGKPLVDLCGRPMIVRVATQARLSAAAGVVVATDDERVERIVRDADIDGVEAMMTRADHASGSDRVMEVVAARGWRDDEIVVNVQGDEPLLPPEVIDQVAQTLRRGPARVATLCEPIAQARDLFDPNVVKVVVDRVGRALYFSRAPVPWSRTEFDGGVPSAIGTGWKRHIGIYAYRVDALRAFVACPPSALETTESLEQLRLLEHGQAIAVAEAVAAVPGGVDTPADVERVRAVLRA